MSGDADGVRASGIDHSVEDSNPDGGLGTSVEAILAAIDRAWSDRGVAILVDLGGAETNSEMAVEMLDDARSGKVVVCNGSA